MTSSYASQDHQKADAGKMVRLLQYCQSRNANPQNRRDYAVEFDWESYAALENAVSMSDAVQALADRFDGTEDVWDIIDELRRETNDREDELEYHEQEARKVG